MHAGCNAPEGWRQLEYPHGVHLTRELKSGWWTMLGNQEELIQAEW